VLQDVGGYGVSKATAMNDAGWSVGYSNTGRRNADAVLWSPSGQATVLQDAGGFGYSYANAVNAVVVKYSDIFLIKLRIIYLC